VTAAVFQDGRPVQPFWHGLRDFGANVAVIEGRSGSRWTYVQLAEEVDRLAETLAAPRRGLILVCAQNDFYGVVACLAAWRSGHALLLAPTAISPASMHALIQAYRPVVVIAPDALAPPLLPTAGRTALSLPGYGVHFAGGDAASVHPNLALVLGTSGSSASPKAARISCMALSTNAHQIVDALGIGQANRAFLTLPLTYVYGLSVVTSHLSVGASLFVDNRSLLDRELLKASGEAEVDTLVSVTFTLDLLRSMGGLDRWAPRSLRRLTHSGSAMDDALLGWLSAEARSRRLDVFRMYGMTEASGRMSVLPPELFHERPKSVGRAVSSGEVRIGPSHSVIYSGPNVMLGYAAGAEDLLRGDEMKQQLETGDLGELDSDGLLYLHGRKSRLMKMLGLRLNLDSIEQRFADISPVAAMSDDRTLVIFAESHAAGLLDARLQQVADELHLPRRLIELRTVPSLPRTPSGKIRYGALAV